ncbi:FAD-binding oxidoreductase [Ruegeria sp. 2205SS24-7]|uniref:FAD-binding oxidoreductase n=1 Tax=Ruegeria discodermiae TaxID=3064389 RepID=UPI0027421A4F|nr:FAD-binding oxidoreductase [Ruegeria sp. 2205SS24-7]MDP5219024.1 FAD-binding oxidoreductase [Ruegeria sp. 2205SS24-7]
MTSLSPSAPAIVDETLGGKAFAAGASAYESSRQVWNATIDRYPALVIRCDSVEDVQAAVKHAVSLGAPVSVRGGGHNIAGTAVGDGAVMIDLSAMNKVEVDSVAKCVCVGGGATLAKLDAETQLHGLATPGGVVSSTGVGGLTLGGGIGWLARRHGLSIDNFVSAQVVLADGRLLTASEAENADLFWALRGGGGNFGVVTRFEFRLHPVGPEVCFGPTFFALSDAAEVLTAYAREAEHLTRDACVWANLMTAPPFDAVPVHWHGQKVLTLLQFHAGQQEQAVSDLSPLNGGVTPIGNAFGPRSFVEAQSFLDPAYEFGARNYWRSHNHLTLTPELISTLVDLVPDLPTPESELLICQIGGAVGDVAHDATAFAHRGVRFMSTPGVRWAEPGDDAAMIAWLRNASDRIAEQAVPGAYVNFVAEDGAADSAYASNLARLRRIKGRYDPNNLFRVNQNIEPIGAPDS